MSEIKFIGNRVRNGHNLTKCSSWIRKTIHYGIFPLEKSEAEIYSSTCNQVFEQVHLSYKSAIRTRVRERKTGVKESFIEKLFAKIKF